jgi:hypothetical protein
MPLEPTPAVSPLALSKRQSRHNGTLDRFAIIEKLIEFSRERLEPSEDGSSLP